MIWTWAIYIPPKLRWHSAAKRFLEKSPPVSCAWLKIRTRTCHFFHEEVACPLQRAVLRAVSTMLRALAGGWGRSAPPAPKLDPGAVFARPPPWGAAPVRPALSRRSRAGPLPTACPTTCGPPAPDFSSQDAQPLSPPPKLQLRISGVLAPFGRQQCHTGGVLSPGVRHALINDRANKRGIAAQREALSKGAVHHEVEGITKQKAWNMLSA